MNIQLLGKRDVARVVGRQALAHPGRDTGEVRFENVEAGLLETVSQLCQVIRGPPELPPGHVEKLEENERRYCDRELTRFELGPKRAGHGVLRLEDPPPKDRRVEDELPQRVSRILRMTAVTSKSLGAGFRLT